VARIIWRDMLDQEMESVRGMLTRLEAAQAQHSESLRTATALWAEQIGYLRARTQGIGEISESQRVDIQNRLDELHAEVARLGGFATQTQVQERMLNQLEREQGRTSLAVTQLADAHSELLERIERRFDRLETRVNKHSSDIRTLIVSIVFAMASLVAMAWIVGHGAIVPGS
jgi:hypothetical protein